MSESVNTLRNGHLRLASRAILEALQDQVGTRLDLGAGRPVQLNELAGEILALCDGTRTLPQLLAELQRRKGPQRDCTEAASEFLTVAHRLGWIEYTLHGAITIDHLAN